MLLTIILLGVALLPTGDENWVMSHGSSIDAPQSQFLGGVPTLCYYRSLGDDFAFSIGTSQGVSMLVSMFVLIFGYIARVVQLSTRASALSRRHIRVVPGAWLRSVLDRNYGRLANPQGRLFFKLTYVILCTAYLGIWATFDLYGSMLWEVSAYFTILRLDVVCADESKISWLVFALVWGSVHVFIARSPAALVKQYHHYSNDSFDSSKIALPLGDKEWTFGQCIALILLALPIFTIGESCLGKLVL